MATSIHFRQYDSRWANKRYPSWGTGTYKYCGCGATTAAIIISSWNPAITPKIVGDWISKQKQGATKGGASYWITGVLAAIKHFGGTYTTCATMTKFFEMMYAAKKAGIDMYGILDVKGSKGGVTWTKGGGHYIPVTDIKKSGNDWLLYVKDPSLRKNTGWFSFNKHLKDHCKLAAVVPVPAKKTTTPAAPAPVKTPTAAERICNKAIELAYAKGTSTTRCGYKAGKAKEAYKTALNKAYPDRKNWSKPYQAGASCDIFVGTVMRATGLDTGYPRGRGTAWNNGQMAHLAASSKWQQIKVADAKAGDVFIYSTNASGSKGHTGIILNKTDVIEASYGDFYPVIKGTRSTRLSSKGKAKLKVYRYKG